MKKKYTSPELELISFQLDEVLIHSALNNDSGEIGGHTGGPGEDDDLGGGLPLP